MFAQSASPSSTPIKNQSSAMGLQSQVSFANLFGRKSRSNTQTNIELESSIGSPLASPVGLTLTASNLNSLNGSGRKTRTSSVDESKQSDNGAGGLRSPLLTRMSSALITPLRSRATSRQSNDDFLDSQKTSGEEIPLDPLAAKLAMMRQGSSRGRLGSSGGSPIRSPPRSASKLGLLGRSTLSGTPKDGQDDRKLTFKQRQKEMKAQQLADRASSADPNDVFGATVRRIAEEKRLRDEAEAAARELAEKKEREKAEGRARGSSFGVGWFTSGTITGTSNAAAATIEEGDENEEGEYGDEKSFDSDMHSSMPSSLASYELLELGLREKRTHFEIKQLKSYPYEERYMYWEQRAIQYAKTPLPDMKTTASGAAHQHMHDDSSFVSESSLDTYAQNQKIFEELLNTSYDNLSETSSVAEADYLRRQRAYLSSTKLTDTAAREMHYKMMVPGYNYRVKELRGELKHQKEYNLHWSLQKLAVPRPNCYPPGYAEKLVKERFQHLGEGSVSERGSLNGVEGDNDSSVGGENRSVDTLTHLGGSSVDSINSKGTENAGSGSAGAGSAGGRKRHQALPIGNSAKIRPSTQPPAVSSSAPMSAPIAVVPELVPAASSLLEEPVDTTLNASSSIQAPAVSSSSSSVKADDNVGFDIGIGATTELNANTLPAPVKIGTKIYANTAPSPQRAPELIGGGTEVATAESALASASTPVLALQHSKATKTKIGQITLAIPDPDPVEAGAGVNALLPGADNITNPVDSDNQEEEDDPGALHLHLHGHHPDEIGGRKIIATHHYHDKTHHGKNIAVGQEHMDNAELHYYATHHRDGSRTRHYHHDASNEAQRRNTGHHHRHHQQHQQPPRRFDECDDEEEDQDQFDSAVAFSAGAQLSSFNDSAIAADDDGGGGILSSIKSILPVVSIRSPISSLRNPISSIRSAISGQSPSPSSNTAGAIKPSEMASAVKDHDDSGCSDSGSGSEKSNEGGDREPVELTEIQRLFASKRVSEVEIKRRATARDIAVGELTKRLIETTNSSHDDRHHVQDVTEKTKVHMNGPDVHDGSVRHSPDHETPEHSMRHARPSSGHSSSGRPGSGQRRQSHRPHSGRSDHTSRRTVNHDPCSGHGSDDHDLGLDSHENSLSHVHGRSHHHHSRHHHHSSSHGGSVHEHGNRNRDRDHDQGSSHSLSNDHPPLVENQVNYDHLVDVSKRHTTEFQPPLDMEHEHVHAQEANHNAVSAAAPGLGLSRLLPSFGHGKEKEKHVASHVGNSEAHLVFETNHLSKEEERRRLKAREGQNILTDRLIDNANHHHDERHHMTDGIHGDTLGHGHGHGHGHVHGHGYGHGSHGHGHGHGHGNHGHGHDGHGSHGHGHGSHGHGHDGHGHGHGHDGHGHGSHGHGPNGHGHGHGHGHDGHGSHGHGSHSERHSRKSVLPARPLHDHEVTKEEHEANELKLKNLQDELARTQKEEARREAKSHRDESKVDAVGNVAVLKGMILGDELDKFYLKTHGDQVSEDKDVLLGKKHVTHEIVHRYNTHGAGTAKKFALPQLVKERTKDVAEEMAAFG